MAELERLVNPGGAAGVLPSRRDFLSTAAACGAAAAVGGLWPAVAAGARPRPIGRGATWSLAAVRVKEVFGDGSTVPFFRFQAVGGTPSNGTLPLLEATEERLVEVHIANDLALPIQPEIIGHDRGPVIPPGRVGRMRFRVPRAGTWLFTDTLLGPAAGPVGLGAMLISRRRPRSGMSVGHDREYVLLYQDTDDRWNLALDAGMQPDLSVYEPNFHTVNGLSFPALAGHPDCRIVCNVGERVLLRLGNLGHVRQAIHFHGYHVEIAARDNVAETMLPMKDTIPLPGYSTAEFILPVTQPGLYPLHPHGLTTTTDNGLYPYGQILLIDAT